MGWLICSVKHGFPGAPLHSRCILHPPCFARLWEAAALKVDLEHTSHHLHIQGWEGWAQNLRDGEVSIAIHAGHGWLICSVKHGFPGAPLHSRCILHPPCFARLWEAAALKVDLEHTSHHLHIQGWEGWAQNLRDGEVSIAIHAGHGWLICSVKHGFPGAPLHSRCILHPPCFARLWEAAALKVDLEHTSHHLHIQGWEGWAQNLRDGEVSIAIHAGHGWLICSVKHGFPGAPLHSRCILHPPCSARLWKAEALKVDLEHTSHHLRISTLSCTPGATVCGRTTAKRLDHFRRRNVRAAEERRRTQAR